MAKADFTIELTEGLQQELTKTREAFEAAHKVLSEEQIREIVRDELAQHGIIGHSVPLVGETGTGHVVAERNFLTTDNPEAVHSITVYLDEKPLEEANT